jgi:hypothetical protein
VRVPFHSSFIHVMGIPWLQSGFWCSDTKNLLQSSGGNLPFLNHLSPQTGRAQDAPMKCFVMWIQVSPSWVWNPSNICANNRATPVWCPSKGTNKFVPFFLDKKISDFWDNFEQLEPLWLCSVQLPSVSGRHHFVLTTSAARNELNMNFNLM